MSNIGNLRPPIPLLLLFPKLHSDSTLELSWGLAAAASYWTVMFKSQWSVCTPSSADSDTDKDARGKNARWVSVGREPNRGEHLQSLTFYMQKEQEDKGETEERPILLLIDSAACLAFPL
ncbi:unnamed protein product [Pleuronectes platessa]|uniref:Uncharacterized protein n=1 Tax=Pleuronectes platessa TaxID=8262 RepID=A0A9N7YUC5_PLEPL|nr:unnamed protein product [Pleuronectes platessa]